MRQTTSQGLNLFGVEQTESTSDDYLTPRWVFETLGLTFDLDVASPPWDTHVPAARKFTKADDGLLQPWEGRVWMNPPYSGASSWAARFVNHRHGIALMPWAKSAWTIHLWNEAEGIALPSRTFDFDGGSISYMVMFAAFGDECVGALANLGRVR
jgi:hypothetical protein